MGDTDEPITFKVDYGLKMMQPQSFAGLKIVVSDNVPDDQVLTFGEQTIVGRRAYEALRNSIADLGGAATDATEAVARVGKTMGKMIDQHFYDTLAGTLIDPNPEQTAMERNPLWGAF